MPEFHNPFNFVRSLPRAPRERNDSAGNPFGDGAGPGHDRYRPGLWTGRIKVRLTVETPLVLCGRGVKSPGDPRHLIYPVRERKDRTADGQWKKVPDLRRSEVRGMLRSAFEAVTNSRLAVFPKKNEERLAYRLPTNDPPPEQLVPALVRNGRIELQPGDGVAFASFLSRGTVAKPWTMYAAWLPRYPAAVRLLEGGEPRHGQEVRFSAWEFTHARGFRAWRVHQLTDANSEHLPQAPAGALPQAARHTPTPGSGMTGLSGWIYVSNRNIGNKHDERVFFNTTGIAYTSPLSQQLAQQWKTLLRNYAEIHREELEDRRSKGIQPSQYLGNRPGRTGWSPHVYDPSWDDIEGRAQLCYARLRRVPGKAPHPYEVIALYPVALSRDLYERSPFDLLDASLRPAAALDELSAADRTFGWVRQETDSDRGGSQAAHRGRVNAYRSHVVVRPVRLVHEPPDGAVERFAEEALPLAILGQPKAAQGRFYVGKANGLPQPNGGTKPRRGYGSQPDQALRGRKVYPHHRHLSGDQVPADYWLSSGRVGEVIGVAATQAGGLHREYIRAGDTPDKQRDSQNRSIAGWVRPGTVFEFEIDVLNLPRAELGALLFLLSLENGHFVKLGLGKPLGLGSVRLEAIGVDLRDGEAERAWYRSFAHAVEGDREEEEAGRYIADLTGLGDFRDAFRKAAWEIIGKPAENDAWPSFVQDFLKAARGIGSPQVPVHYPRITDAPRTMGENYQWFVNNDRVGGRGACLPTIGETLQR